MFQAKNDTLFFIENDGSGLVKAKATTLSVHNSDKMTVEESVTLVNNYADALQLTDMQFKRWAGKRYIVIVQIGSAQGVEPFALDKSEYGNMDDWLPVGNIESIMVHRS